MRRCCSFIATKNIPQSSTSGLTGTRRLAGILAQGEKLLEPFAQRLRDASIAIEERLMVEPAGKAISEVAKAENCKMIIMDSGGLNLSHIFVGSIINQVLQTASCPVLVVC